MIYPALTAAAMGVHFGLTKEQIGAGIAHYQATKMRMEVLRPGHGTIIYNDTYNANPQSMKAGLSALSQTAGVRHVAVVGDMFELGREEERCHREIGSFAAGLRIDTIVTVGRAAEYIADEAKKHGMKDVRAVKDKAEAEQILGELIAPDTAYFVKASHGMALEELAAFLEEKIKAM
jgi:UDP-N-acetylmuramoyl-tripeptide--D-alanyl-D-alanine ligase